MVQQDRALATRQQIVRGAASTFDTEGFAGASMGMIVEQSGTTRGALHFHFRTKEELARAVIEEQHCRSIAAVENIDRCNSPAVEQIVMLCHEMARQIVTDPIVRAGIRLTLELTSARGPVDPYRSWIEACEMLVERARNQGDILDSVSSQSLSRFVISAFTGVQLVSLVLTGREDLELRVDDMWSLLLPGIMPASRCTKIDRIRAARWYPHP
ncbi:ScbR family autoregulator-binding transcription factor [Nocardia sp. FBN12]|uniref:ScbR family autoregulator-binding transcription factor n=1 Tax=Nocardia sp. FBN12 TaxID=3419766 RepID=UPI003D05F5DA